LPRSDKEVDICRPFDGEELIFRRASPSEINSVGELDPSQLASVSFGKEFKGAPSVLRGAFSVPSDALTPDCSGGKDSSHCSVFQMKVTNLPKEVVSGDGRKFDFYPLHDPLPTCGAHSVISCCHSGDPQMEYVVPPRAVKNQLRSTLASFMKKVEAAVL
jgi:hypothetical protein